MYRFRRSRPSQPDAGFTLIEVMVAAAVTLIVLVAAADLLANLMTRTAKIQEAEQARSIVYQVSERARAVGCGAVYASESDLDIRARNCADALKLPSVGTKCPTTAPIRIFGDASNLCWSDGDRVYRIRMQTGWDYSDARAQAAGPPALPDMFVRTFTITKDGGTQPIIDPITFREAAPERIGLGATRACSPSTPNGTPTLNGITHSIPASTGQVLFPYVVNPTC